MASHLAILRGLLCRDGVDRMRADIDAALPGLSPATSWRATALLLEGIAVLLDGQVDTANPILAHAVEVGMDAAALPAASTALAERCLRRRPDLGTLPAQVEELRSSLDTARTVLPGASSSLTTAELRLLPLLATHLTLAEIGQRLYLSKHTVKTQAISVYRKLGASSAARRSNGCRRSACSRGRPLTPSGRAHSFHPDRGMPVACLA